MGGCYGWLLWVAAMACCYGWLLWLAAMAGCYGRLLWLASMADCNGWLLWLAFMADFIPSLHFQMERKGLACGLYYKPCYAHRSKIYSHTIIKGKL
jgi:hypothetical protein